MDTSKLKIRISTEDDFASIMDVEKQAFGEDDEAQLTADLLNDESAEPLISLLAFYKKEAIGHILFTRVFIDDADSPLCHILAPMAVKPEFQRKGIGGLLIKEGLQILKNLGAEMVFVLGHIKYYPRYGFINNAGRFGLEAPYPIPKEVADAWMVQELKPGAIKNFKGKVTCAETLMKPEYWRE